MWLLFEMTTAAISQKTTIFFIISRSCIGLYVKYCFYDSDGEAKSTFPAQAGQ